MPPGSVNAQTLSRESHRLGETIGAAAAREVLLAALTDRVARIALSDRELRAVAPSLLQMGLVASRSPRRVVSRPDRGKGGFANRFATRHPQRHPEARWLVYLARDREATRDAQHAEDRQTSDAFATALRYPLCCMAFYNRYWPRAERWHQGDLFPYSHAATPMDRPGHSLLNFGANYFGGGWTSFFPCSLTCAHAIRLLREDRHSIRSINVPLADEADRQASRPIIYTEYRGIAQLGDWHLERNADIIRFDPDKVVLTVPPSSGPLWRSLMGADGIRPSGRRGFDLYRGLTRVHRQRSADAFVRTFADVSPRA